MSKLTSGILSDLPKPLLFELFARAPVERRKERDTLFTADTPGSDCFYVEAGLLKISVESPQGDERILAILGAGSIVGEISLIDNLPRSATVTCLEDCVLRLMTRNAFYQHLGQRPELYRELMKLLASRLREADSALAAISFLTGRGRLARAMLELANVIGKKNRTGAVSFSTKISQAELAAMAGVARENVSRVMSSWIKQKIISRTSQFYAIHDTAALEREMTFES
jgi:CRP/FNR family transcriptional regulator, cyclic AMP receptor protein